MCLSLTVPHPHPGCNGTILFFSFGPHPHPTAVSHLLTPFSLLLLQATILLLPHSNLRAGARHQRLHLFQRALSPCILARFGSGLRCAAWVPPDRALLVQRHPHHAGSATLSGLARVTPPKGRAWCQASVSIEKSRSDANWRREGGKRISFLLLAFCFCC